MLETQCTKAYKVIKILSSDSFGVCPEVVWDYFYSLHNDLLQTVYKGNLSSLIFLSLFFFIFFKFAEQSRSLQCGRCKEVECSLLFIKCNLTRHLSDKKKKSPLY